MHHTAPLKKGYKFRLYPTPEQEQELNRVFGHARHVWNLVLTATQTAYAAWHANPTQPKPSANYLEFNRQLTQLKQERPYLYEVSSTVLQQKLMDLDRAYQNFFSRRGGYPKFKKRHAPQSVRFAGKSFRLRDGQLILANCEAPYRVRWSRPLPSTPSQVTISRDPDGRYYASFLCTYTLTPTTGTEEIALDMGISSFYTDSHGGSVAPPKYYQRAQRRLHRAQRALARKTPGSRNREQQRQKVAALHAKIKRQRCDFLHKLSTDLVRTHQLIAVETLNLRWMTSNRHLAKAVQDQGWRMFLSMIAYKCIASQHCELVFVERHFASTQLCSTCEFRWTGDIKLKLNQRTWTCPCCGAHHDRDTNAAVNILQRAQQVPRTPGKITLM